METSIYHTSPFSHFQVSYQSYPAVVDFCPATSSLLYRNIGQIWVNHVQTNVVNKYPPTFGRSIGQSGNWQYWIIVRKLVVTAPDARSTSYTSGKVDLNDSMGYRFPLRATNPWTNQNQNHDFPSMLKLLKNPRVTWNNHSTRLNMIGKNQFLSSQQKIVSPQIHWC
jgi:hypothetical protein